MSHDHGGARPGAGRPAGSQNKLTKAAKDAFALAFDEIGGAEALAEWGRKNRTEFYRLYSKLIPVDTQVSGPGGGAVVTEIVIRGVDPSDEPARD